MTEATLTATPNTASLQKGTLSFPAGKSSSAMLKAMPCTLISSPKPMEKSAFYIPVPTASTVRPTSTFLAVQSASIPQATIRKASTLRKPWASQAARLKSPHRETTAKPSNAMIRSPLAEAASKSIIPATFPKASRVPIWMSAAAKSPLPHQEKPLWNKKIVKTFRPTVQP